MCNICLLLNSIFLGSEIAPGWKCRSPSNLLNTVGGLKGDALWIEINMILINKFIPQGWKISEGQTTPDTVAKTERISHKFDIC